MSILIKGVKMPKSCGDCPCQQEEYGYCQVIEEEARFCDYTSRPEWCPLVALPEHHGRLVDMDALSDVMYREAFETDSPLQKWDSGCWIRYKMFEHARDNAPTVIEEE